MLFAAPPNGKKHQYIFVQIHSNEPTKYLTETIPVLGCVNNDRKPTT